MCSVGVLVQKNAQCLAKSYTMGLPQLCPFANSSLQFGI